MPKTPNTGSPTPPPPPTAPSAPLPSARLAGGPLATRSPRALERDTSCPSEPQDESIGDLVRLLARSRPSYRRTDLCLWSK